jgi:shikimate kinase
MKGTARTYGAITIANALPSGIGCAAGIALPVDAEISLTFGGVHDPPTIELSKENRSAIVEESVRAALSAYSPRRGAVARVSLRSEIPVARGLKSSSAVSTAVMVALARATGVEPEPIDIGRRCAEVGRQVGVSATGALDDALAGLEPGLVVTDNRHDRVLRRSAIQPDWGVLLYIPSGSHPPSTTLAADFSRERAAGEQAAHAVLEGDWPRAMRLNTELVERTMGYSYRALRTKLEERGAIASGVSGLGPTLAAIAPTSRLGELVDQLPDDGAERRLVSFIAVPACGGEVP